MTRLSIDHSRINAAIAKAEENTSGEITCVIRRKSLGYPETPLGWAAVAAFTLPLAVAGAGMLPHDWLAGVLRLIFGWNGVGITGDLMTWEVVLTYAAFQLLLFAAVYGLIRFTPLTLWLTPVATRHKRAHDKALEQFYAQGLHKTRERTGVLIFCALEEHHVEVIADEGIYARVDKTIWADAIRVLVRNIKSGDLTQGYEEAIAICGAVLAQHFPPGATNPNESPDVLIEI